TGTVSAREAQDQFLDNMELERERGITIKAQSVRMNWRSKKDGKDYVLNLIDTPGHVDFAYEVSRSLASCDGAILVVDASQGVEAQTLANAHLAAELGLEMVPVLNKIDLPGAEPERIKEQVENLLAMPGDDCLLISAKTGDTVTRALAPATSPLPGFREVKPMVFAGLFPVDADDYEDTRDAVEKLSLNDAAFKYEPENSKALGFGFRCGFLGLLHMDIIRERLEREYDLRLVQTMPGVEYSVTLTDGTVVPIRSPNEMPDPVRVDAVREPFIRAKLLA